MTMVNSGLKGLKLRIIILRSEMGSTPQYLSEMTYYMIVIIRFFVNFFQNGHWRPSWILPIFKKCLNLTKIHPADFESKTSWATKINR